MGLTLTVSRLTKRFGEETAVTDLSFTVSPGELFAFLGPSGAGKSTTLNLIAGLEKPDSGDILADGQSILEVKSAQRDFAMVFESYALYPHFTVAENIAFPLRAPGRSEEYSESKINDMVLETCKMLEIEELLDRYPRELSGGQKQRVGLGRALARRPRLFLMDEPIAHLDAKLRHHMRGELKKLQEKLGVTTLLATPDYHEVVAMADRAAILSHGRIEQIGTPIELYNEPQNVIVANSIGDPPINLLDCVIEKKGDALSLVGDGFSITCGTALGEKITRQGTTDGLILGVRPNDMVLEKDSRKGLIETEVYVFEPLGGEAVATLSLGAKRIKVVCPWEERLKIGDKVAVNFSAENIHLFDKETGKALAGQASQNPQRKE